ncbi:MAG: response regulator [Planctomycetia bacterium]|nr:response regulator [Planctomycetia bacterium]
MNSALRIAVADDEPFLRAYFQDVLPDLGHEVVGAAATGRELVELCQRTNPDLVISDIRMPDMDGIDAAAEISRERQTPIILVSAFHDPEYIARAEQSYILAYLIKPVERAHLETAIAIVRRRFAEFESLRQETKDLKQALEDRKTIEKAKGVLMRRTRLAEHDAFRTMQKLSRDQNLKLIEVARKILESEGPAPPRR